jgi:hypothetical protein
MAVMQLYIVGGNGLDWNMRHVKNVLAAGLGANW